MKRALSKTAFAVALAMLVASCSTPVNIGYKADGAVPPSGIGRADVRVGTFEDHRKNAGSQEIGSIRGGFGNPLYVLTVSEPIPDIVRKAFADGLAARGWLADRPMHTSSADAHFVVSGQVNRLDCNQLVRPEAHADFVVTLTETASGRVVATKAVKRDDISGFTLATGIFASSDELRDMTSLVLQEAVDGALDSPEFVQALAATARPR